MEQKHEKNKKALKEAEGILNRLQYEHEKEKELSQKKLTELEERFKI